MPLPVAGIVVAFLQALAVVMLARGIGSLLRGRWRPALLAVGGVAIFLGSFEALPAIAPYLEPSGAGAKVAASPNAFFEGNMAVLRNSMVFGVFLGVIVLTIGNMRRDRAKNDAKIRK
jgi:hypothetical protein